MTTTPVKARVEVLTPSPTTYSVDDLTAAFLSIAEAQEVQVTKWSTWENLDWSLSVALDVTTNSREHLDSLATALRNLTGYPARDVIVRRRKR